MNTLESRIQQIHQQLIKVNAERKALEHELEGGGWMTLQASPIPVSIHKNLLAVLRLHAKESALSREMIALKKIQMDKAEIELLSLVADISCN